MKWKVLPWKIQVPRAILWVPQATGLLLGNSLATSFFSSPLTTGGDLKVIPDKHFIYQYSLIHPRGKRHCGSSVSPASICVYHRAFNWYLLIAKWVLFIASEVRKLCSIGGFMLIFAIMNLHTTLLTEENLLGIYWLQEAKELVKLSTWLKF